MHDTVAHILKQEQHVIPGKLNVNEIFFEVPIDYGDIGRGKLTIFARAVTKHEMPAVDCPEQDKSKGKKLPWMVYLQGGPGFGCAAPQHTPLTEVVLARGYQILYLDQRGTGLSTTITSETLALQGDLDQQVSYLKAFRADNIVNDCEAIRKILTADYPDHLKKWSVFGQSFGGFCALTYLSRWPQGLREVFTTGGLAPIMQTPDVIYQRTYVKMIARNKAYYEKYPEDVDGVLEITSYIRSKGSITLPSGTTLTVRLFMTLGRNLGFHGGLDFVHDLILRTRADLSQFRLITRPTLSELDTALSFENNILYAILHEAIYCQGTASSWSAERVGKTIPEFHWLSDSVDRTMIDKNSPMFFAGEMIYQFMFEVFPELEKLAQVANIIAEYSDWPELYDMVQLAQNEVPLYSLTYIDDIYVDYGLAVDTAGYIKHCRHAITNGLYHDAIRSKSADAFKLLFALRDEGRD